VIRLEYVCSLCSTRQVVDVPLNGVFERKQFVCIGPHGARHGEIPMVALAPIITEG